MEEYACPIDTREAARRLGVSRRHVNDLCEDGELEGAFRSGRKWCIPPEAVEVYKDRNHVAPAPRSRRPHLVLSGRGGLRPPP